MSQGILTSTDATAFSVEEISIREGELTRTGIEAVRAEPLSWADLLRVTVTNTGQTRLASPEKWDFIVHYSDADGASYSAWLPYTKGNLSANRWLRARIGLSGPLEFFEPGIVNPGEELVILARLDPLPGDNTTGGITVVTPNGVYDSISFSNPDKTLLTPHAENTTLSSTRYYAMAEDSAADSAGLTFRADFSAGGRTLLANEDQAARPAKLVFPLTGIIEIPAATWTFRYRCLVGGDGFPAGDGDVRFNADVLVRRADGTIRATLASEAASAFVDQDESGTWLTKSAAWACPGYTVVDEDDYLEIDYYGQTGQGSGGTGGYMLLRIDDISLSPDEQTGIEA
ncbi:MAG: hypothetical protein A2Y92_02480 [Chloroflexi bacterium RBG_13_57_8]|nr:MAG: hypothetical protein A2Y92_02480 [Chloroflexi bacterium RBG_13_57_8]